MLTIQTWCALSFASAMLPCCLHSIGLDEWFTSPSRIDAFFLVYSLSSYFCFFDVSLIQCLPLLLSASTPATLLVSPSLCCDPDFFASSSRTALFFFASPSNHVFLTSSLSLSLFQSALPVSAAKFLRVPLSSSEANPVLLAFPLFLSASLCVLISLPMSLRLRFSFGLPLCFFSTIPSV